MSLEYGKVKGVNDPGALRQGNRLNVSGGSANDFFHVDFVLSGPLMAVFQAGARFGLGQQVHRHVFDDRHVGGPMGGAQAREIVMEDDIQYPMEAVFDPPMAAHDACEGFSIELA